MKVEVGHNVQVHYKGTFKDGTEFDNSWSREAPISFTVGDNRMIAGFSSAVVGMANGDKKTITVAPEEAYGPHLSEATRKVPLQEFGDLAIEVGGMIRGNGPTGPFVARIVEVDKKEEVATLDMNHPLAGKELNFEIEMVMNYGTMPNPELGTSALKPSPTPKNPELVSSEKTGE